MKYNYQIIIEYLGSNFVGWQIQNNGKSIQEIVQKALLKTFKSKIKIIGSGRTDAGVHAIGQSANFFLNEKIKNKIRSLSTINFYLKKYPISILDLKRKNLNFHARFSAKKRLYEYLIINRKSKLSVDNGKAWLVKKKLDLKAMKKSIKILIGIHDFSTFRSSSCGAKTPVRKMIKASIVKTNNKIIFKFESQSFLQQQVRSMVGCLKYVGDNKWTIKKFQNVFKSKKRVFCAPPAPPEGLYLKKVFY
ncbi:MAG: tRNA pseudouridine(38-40) synthase TruA [Candidatus Pelagibacter sp. TMED128]|nr:MAG: tRNA pseudouridine(38-40) synthase TruA [Candidatus Pelagibacter sp. TMED128]